ncbi:MAG: hypothetical protein PUE58_03815 [Lachnospiraceae bacterium]|nr:hypothetical protein [Lachnospiraceae bacterium]
MTHATQGSTGISFSSSSVKVGDTVKVTVTGTGIDQIRVTFTAKCLTLTGCTASGYTLSGSTVSFMGNRAVLTFSATAAGSAEFAVRANVLSGCSAIMKVTDPAAEKQTQDQSTKTDQTAKSDQSSQNTTDTSGDASVLKVGDVSYKLSTPETLPTELLQKTQVTIDNTSYPAYILKDANDDFYYFYASANDADPDWYQYDSDAKTMTRANDKAFELLDQNNSAKDHSDSSSADKSTSNNKKGLKAALASLKDKIVNADSNTKLRVLLVIGAILVILLVISIISMIRHRKDKREADPFDEDIYPDENADGIDNDDEKNIEDDESDEEVENDTEVETNTDVETDTDLVNDHVGEENADDSESASSDFTDTDGLNSADGTADTDNLTPDSTYRTISGMELDDHLDDDLEDLEADEQNAQNVPSDFAADENNQPASAEERADAEPDSAEPADKTRKLPTEEELTAYAHSGESAQEAEAESAPSADESISEAESAPEDTEAENPLSPDSTPEDNVREESASAGNTSEDAAEENTGDTAFEETSSNEASSDDISSEDSSLEAEKVEEDEEDHPAKKKKSFFRRRRDQDVWGEDVDEPSRDPIKPVNHAKMIENAKKRKKKLGNDDDFMDLNDF